MLAINSLQVNTIPTMSSNKDITIYVKKFLLQYVYGQVAASYNLTFENESHTAGNCNINTSSHQHQLQQQVQSEANTDMLLFQIAGKM